MSEYKPENSDNTPPSVPEEYRQESIYPPQSWDAPSSAAGKFNPYQIKAEPQEVAPAFNPYKPPVTLYNPQNPYGQNNSQPYTQPVQAGGIPAAVGKAQSSPIVTYTILGAIGVIFVVEFAVQAGKGSIGALGGFNLDTLINLGALQKDLTRQGEIWRLFTAMFLHASLLHIVFNGLALWSLGMHLEQQMGRARFLLIYFLGGLSGSLLSFGLGNPNSVSVGASGAIFALLGGLIGFYLNHRFIFGQMGRSQLNSLVFTAVINFVILLSIPQVDNLAHLGGLLAGLFLGYFLPSDYRQRSNSKALEYWAVFALLVAMSALLYLFMNQPTRL
ncbi:rhomboid family intramembrane serine protease [Candidatus Chlorohelix sp.]|uniref:rhomboid family intramembrane serine protease n=1 Tax=Candidatus Chlorohelix sp. TaxID=3139201 RepID=UPI00302F7643